MGCPSDDVLSALAEGRLSPDEVQSVTRHADACPACRKVIAELARRTQELAPADRNRDPTLPAPPNATPEGDKGDDEKTHPYGHATVVGRYQILKHLATGGMGSVYEAYDPQLDRRVALKVLSRDRRGHRADEELQLRLQREAQAMARLAHPNVVAVHDVGTHDGRVFLAMEFVAGLTLRKWLKAKPRTWQEIRDVFVQAGRGLAAAHAVGLVHRDFKPDNVLIGADGRVRVADFGLARPGAVYGSDPGAAAPSRDDARPSQRASLVDSQLTEAGAVMGTPRYMAPEQIRAQLTDARTDQFSFGIALYEALYRVRPYAGKALDERLRNIDAGTLQPPAPGHGIPDWLGAAVRQAIRGRADLRFPSMEALLDALTQDTRRRRLGGGAVAAIAVVAVAAIAGGSWALRPDLRCRGAERRLSGVWDPPRREAVRAAFLASGAKGAEAQFERTARALDDYARAWVAVDEETCAASRIRGEQPESVRALQASCLGRRLKELSKLASLMEGADGALVQKGPDAALGLTSAKSCADASALTDVAPLPEDPAARQQISALQDELAEANAIRLAGQYPAALDKAMAVGKAALPLRYRPLEAEALYLSGVIEDQLGRRDEAVASLVDAVAAGDVGRADMVRARAASRLVWTLQQSARFDEARRWAQLAQAALDRLGGNPEQEGELVMNLGTLYLAQGKLQEGADAYERARKLLVSAVGPEHPKALNALSNLANAYVGLRRPDLAVPILEEVIPAVARLRGEDHPALIPPLVALATARTQQKRYAEAHEATGRAIELARARFGPEHLRVAGCMEADATVWQAEGRYAESLAEYQQVLAMKQKVLGPEEPELFYPNDGIGQSLLGLHRAREALPWLEAAVRLSAGMPDAAEPQFGLAKALWETGGDRRRARQLAEAARESFGKTLNAERVQEIERWLAERK